MINEKKKLLKLEVRSFLLKAVAARLNCYKLTYVAEIGGNKESVLDKYREDETNMLKNLLETLQFAFIISHPGRK